jgi:hypothetical protein
MLNSFLSLILLKVAIHNVTIRRGLIAAGVLFGLLVLWL